MIRRLQAALNRWLVRERSTVDHDSMLAYRDATHVGLGEVGWVANRSNLEAVVDNERYLASFET